MAIIPIVTEEQFAIARRIEDKILSMSEEAGVLFAGVDVDPAPVGGAYDIWVGCDRSMDEKTVGSAVFLLLSREFVEGVNIRRVEVHRGIARG